jgi:hypothetical protein
MQINKNAAELGASAAETARLKFGRSKVYFTSG